MKRLIINTETGKFLKADGGWTTDEGEAMNFNDIPSLVVACSKHKVQRAEILLRFGDKETDVRLPLRSKIP